MSELEALRLEQRLRLTEEKWRRGNLRHLLDSNQQGMYDAIKANSQKQFVIEAARKIGKSYMLGVMAFELALRNPGKRINYVAPTGKEAHEIALPVMGEIRELAPADCKPEWKQQDGHWMFPNRAFINLGGADDQAAADRNRGPESVGNIVDEAGFVPVLGYLIDSVLAPQTLQTGGPMWLASTPPFTPGHDFATLADTAALKGAYLNRNIYTHGRMSREQIDSYLTSRAEARGMTLEQYKRTTDYRREYGAERVIEESLAIIPEWPLVKGTVVVEKKSEDWFDLYISMDPGTADNTGILYAESLFRENALYIQHESLLHGANSATITEEITRTLTEKFPKQNYPNRDGFPIPGVIRPYSAVVDATTALVIRDLYMQHAQGHKELEFGLAEKMIGQGGRDANDNLVRIELQAGRIFINPRCANLIRQIANAIRAKPGGDMIRTVRDGHFDLVAALRYLVRDWVSKRGHNPCPEGFGYDRHVHARREPPPKKTFGEKLLEGTSLARRR